MKENVIGVVGCGWLGLPLAKQLVENTRKVIGTTRSKEKAESIKSSGVDVFICEQTDYVKEHHWLATLDFLVLTLPPAGFGKDYGITLLNLVRQVPAHAKVVFISSTSVYADQNATIDEDTAANGTGRNALIIREAEEKLHAFLRDRLCIIRMGGLIGGERHPAKYMQGRTIDNGRAPINVIHQADAVGLVSWVLENDFFGQIINGVADQHPEKMEYYGWVASQLKLNEIQFKADLNEFKIVQSKHRKQADFYSFQFDSPFDFPLEC